MLGELERRARGATRRLEMKRPSNLELRLSGQEPANVTRNSSRIVEPGHVTCAVYQG